MPGKFERDVEKAARKAVAPTVKKLEADINRVKAESEGKSKDQIERELQQAARSNGVEPGKDLSKVAQDIADGQA